MTTRNVHIETWGCQMNVADSERMLALLARQNFKSVSSPNEADLIILNTCNIREKARHKVLTRLGELRVLKDQNPSLILALSGCVAQTEAQSLKKELPFLDLIFGPDHIEELPQLLSKIMEEADPSLSQFAPQGPLVETEFSESSEYSIPLDAAEPWLDSHRFEATRFVNIIKGCNNFCTYCVVPYTRGREKSRTPEEILRETEFLVDKGVREIVLLGQNVNSYGLDNSDRDEGYLEHTPFIDLLYTVAKVKGLDRLRFVTSNPHDFPHKLPQAFADIPILCDQLHLPVQAGSNTVLKSMHRRYTRELYLEKIAALRAVRPEMAFSADFIVGFPGETDADFEQTMSLIQEVKYAFIFGFKYSPRPLTPAAKFKNQVPEHVKDARLQALLNVQKVITEEQNAAEIGKTRDTLLVYKNKREPTTWYGRTFQGRLVRVLNIEGTSGQTLPVRITDSTATTLVGHPC